MTLSEYLATSCKPKGLSTTLKQVEPSTVYGIINTEVVHKYDKEELDSKDFRRNPFINFTIFDENGNKLLNQNLQYPLNASNKESAKSLVQITYDDEGDEVLFNDIAFTTYNSKNYESELPFAVKLHCYRLTRDYHRPVMNRSSEHDGIMIQVYGVKKEEIPSLFCVTSGIRFRDRDDRGKIADYDVEDFILDNRKLRTNSPLSKLNTITKVREWYKKNKDACTIEDLRDINILELHHRVQQEEYTVYASSRHTYQNDGVEWLYTSHEFVTLKQVNDYLEKKDKDLLPSLVDLYSKEIHNLNLNKSKVSMANFDSLVKMCETFVSGAYGGLDDNVLLMQLKPVYPEFPDEFILNQLKTARGE